MCIKFQDIHVCICTFQCTQHTYIRNAQKRARGTEREKYIPIGCDLNMSPVYELFFRKLVENPYAVNGTERKRIDPPKAGPKPLWVLLGAQKVQGQGGDMKYRSQVYDLYLGIDPWMTQVLKNWIGSCFARCQTILAVGSWRCRMGEQEAALRDVYVDNLIASCARFSRYNEDRKYKPQQ